MEIVLADDNIGEVVIFREIVKEISAECGITAISDGAGILSYLNQIKTAMEKPLPDLIVIDINLPGKSGLDVIAEIKKDEILKTIPVVFYSGSESEEDKKKCYELGALNFFNKSTEWNENLETVKQILNAAGINR